MKQKIRMRILSGFITAAVLTASFIPAATVYAYDHEQVLIDIQKSVDAAIDYSIKHRDEVKYTEPSEPDSGYCWCGYPYWWGDHHHHHHDYPEWIYSGPNDIVLDIGDTYQINVPGGADFQSTNGGVASVNGYGVVTGVNEGTCVIKVIGYRGSLTFVKVKVNGERRNKNNNTNVVYVPQPVYNPAATNASWLAIATNLIVSAPRNSTVNLSSLTPLSFDANFANVLRLRPDVTVNLTYGFNGHTFLLTIPRGYNLAGKLNPYGLIDFVTLSNVVDGKIMCRLLY